MAYRWRHDGPAFEFPTPFGTENRFLIGRAVLLAIAGLAGLLMAGVAGSFENETPVVALEKLPDPGSAWPLVLAGLLMLGNALVNLVQALRQRQMVLQPGQPASLAGEVSREASGAGAGAATLLQAVSRGLAPPLDVAGPWRGPLLRLAPALVSSPGGLQAYLGARLSHGLLALGLGLAALGLLFWPRPGGAAMGALLLMGVGGAVALRHQFDADRPLLSPRGLALALGVGWLGAVALAAAAGVVPFLDKFERYQLPLAALAGAGLALALELMGLLAALGRLERPLAQRPAHEDTEVAFDAHPSQLLREIDRELARRWTDGVPSRRYIWQAPKIDAAAEEGGFTATVLEETQPMAVNDRRSAPAPTGWLLLLDGLGLVLTVAGAALWLRSAWQHLPNAALPWTAASLGAVALLAGGWALRVAHGLWSRVEVDSTITWLECKGSFFRLAGTAPLPASDAPGWSRGGTPVGVEDMTLRSSAVQARSVFYADGPQGLGSRALLTLAANPAASAIWTTLARDFARKLVANPAAATPAALAARAKARARRVAEKVQPAAAPARGARFCPHCGTPLLASARFCQQCGKGL